MISLPVKVVSIVVPVTTTPLALFIVCYLKNKPILSHNLMDFHFADLFLSQAVHHVLILALSVAEIKWLTDVAPWQTWLLIVVALVHRGLFLFKLLSLTAANIARRTYIRNWQVGCLHSHTNMHVQIRIVYLSCALAVRLCQS